MYVTTLIRSPMVLEYLDGSAVGTTMKNLNQSILLKMSVGLPPLAEQHRIVAKVDELTALCDELEAARAEREATRGRFAAACLGGLNAPDFDPTVVHAGVAFAIDNLHRLTMRPHQIKSIRHAIFNLAVRGKLVPQDQADESPSESLTTGYETVPAAKPFSLPESWVWVNVDAVAKVRLGKMLDRAKNKGSLHKYLRNINVRWFDFDLSDLLEMRFQESELSEFSLRCGDVLICEGGEPGRAAVWDGRQTDIYFQKAIHRARFVDCVDPSYFVIALRSSADDGRLQEYFTGTGIQHFTGRGLRSYSFPLPPLAEQHRIIAKIDELMALCDRLEENIRCAEDAGCRALDAVLHETLAPTVRAGVAESVV